MLSATSRSSSSARISLQSVMHSLQMKTDGPEMNFRTESFDFPQNEQRRCLSLDMEPRRDGGEGGVGERWTPAPEASSLFLPVRVRNQVLPRGEDAVDEAVRIGLLGAHEPVAVHVALDRLDRLAGMLGVQRVHLAAEIEDLPRLDLDVG